MSRIDEIHQNEFGIFFRSVCGESDLVRMKFSGFRFRVRQNGLMGFEGRTLLCGKDCAHTHHEWACKIYWANKLKDYARWVENVGWVVGEE